MSLVERARSIHERLMNPPNAVADIGIDLKRKPAPAIVPMDDDVPLELVNEAPAGNPLLDRLAALEIEIRQLNKQLDTANEEFGRLASVTRPRIRDIQEIVCSYYHKNINDMLSQRRNADIMRPRHVAVYLAKILTLKSLPEIGRHFAGRDHTTILFTVRKITALVQTDEELARDIENLKARVFAFRRAA